MLSLWQHITGIGARYGVNPLVFAALYFAHHPLFWGTMAWLTSRVRAKKSISGIVLLGAFFWFLPYTYVFIFGRGLPLWVYAAASAGIAAGGYQAVREVRRRLKESG